MILGSRQMKSEAGSNEHSLKYQFDLELLHMEAVFPRECCLQIVWKRGPNSISTQNPINAVPPSNQIQINEKLSFVSTCTIKQGYFVPKASQIVILLNQNNTPKKIGKYNLQLTSILNPTQYHTNNSKQFAIPLQNCLLKQGLKLYFKLSSQYLSESQLPHHSQTLHQTPSPNLQHQGFLKSLNQHCQMKVSNGSSNMLNTTNGLGTTKGSSGMSVAKGSSGVSGGQACVPGELRMSNFLQKRDIMSVASYASSMRRADSLQKDASGREYGLLSSKKIDYDKQRDNRTENGDSTFAHKQLNDEQNKRSRLEAEINKNKLYIQELKKKLGQMLGAQSKIKEENKIINDQNNDLKKEIEKIKTTQELNNSNQEAIYRQQMQIKQLQQQINNYKNTNKENQINNSKFCYELKRITQQYQMETNKYAQLHIKYIQMQKQCEQYKYQARNNRISMDNINEQIRRNKEQVMKMKQESYRLKDEQHKAKQQLQKHNRQTQQYKDQCMRLKQQLSRCLEQCSRYKNELNRYKEEVRCRSKEQMMQKDSQFHSLEQQLSQCKNNLQRWQQENKVLRQSNRLSQEKQSSLKQECSLLRQQMGACKQETNALRQQLSKQKSESIQHRQQNAQLRQQNLQVRQQLSTLRNEGTSQKKEEVERLARESLQLQVQLKYAREEIDKMESIRSETDELRWKLSLQIKNREEIQQNCERMERELGIKLKQLMIEGEKNRMLTEQVNEAHAAISQMQQSIAFSSPTQKEKQLIEQYEREVTEKNRTIEEIKRLCEDKGKEIYKLKRQINDAQQYAIECKEKNDLLINKCNEEIELRKTEIQNHSERLVQRDLEIQHCKRDVENYKKDIHSYEQEIKGYKMQIEQYKQEINCTREKINNNNKINYDGQNQALQKKIDMMMEEMHLMKKKYEESKPVIKVDQTMRLKQLQYELDKRDKIISKMSKEKLQLDEQNVKMTVQIMKLISELDRYKKTQK